MLPQVSKKSQISRILFIETMLHIPNHTLASRKPLPLPLQIHETSEQNQQQVSFNNQKTLPQAQRHKLSLLFTSLTISTTLDFITK